MLTNLLNVVLQKPIGRWDRLCPFCFSDNIHKGGTRTTLLGWAGGEDPNHKWVHCLCNACGRPFVHESRCGEEWLTDGFNRVLAGVANCFEPYIYTCSNCGGDVTRRHTDRKTGEPVTTLVTTRDGPQYRTFWGCIRCGREVGVDVDSGPVS